MSRTSLRAQLEAYHTPYEDELLFISDFLALTEDPLAFSRERTAGHFTASAWIVNRDRTHVLLALHRKLERWLQLGGHADGNEDLAEVALQEAREESGLSSLILKSGIFDIDKHIIPGRASVPEHFHYDVRYLLEADIDEPLIVSDESLALSWTSLNSVTELVGHNPSILRMLKKT